MDTNPMDEEARNKLRELGSRRRKRQITVYCLPRDVEILEALCEYYGSSQSDMLRSALRHFAAHVGYLERRRSNALPDLPGQRPGS